MFKIKNLVRKFFQIYFFEKIIIFFIRKTHLPILYKLIPIFGSYPKNTIRVDYIDGIKYTMDLYDRMDYHLYFEIPENSRNSLLQLVKPSMVIFDIGTNNGSNLLEFAKLTEREGRCYGFEPSNHNYLRAIENIKSNNFQNINLYNIGLGAKKSKALLSVITDSNLGMNRILQSNSNEFYSESVDIIALDEFVLENKIHKIDLIKIDVEGFEWEVLKGADNVLKKWHPILFIEIDYDNLLAQNSSPLEVVTYLKSLNYSILNAETNTLIDQNEEFKNCHFDIICK